MRTDVNSAVRNPESEYPAVVIVGPTASGKSHLAAELAARFEGEIVNSDAIQIYRGMDIGTAKPSLAERAVIRHHMLDLREPCHDFSAGDYQRLGREALESIRRRARIPFVVGGTGFYLRALIHGLFEGPGRSDQLRARMRKIVQWRGAASLHRALRRADPAIADRLSPADVGRIIRAYEVHLLTGKPMSWWQNQPTDRLVGFRWLKLGILWPRPMLYQRINARVEEMFEKGLVNEVRDLFETFPPDCHAFKAIGYRQIAKYLQGRLSLDEALEQTKRESRRYAKRQLTWFRADPEIVWLEGTAGEELLEEASQRVGSFLGR